MTSMRYGDMNPDRTLKLRYLNQDIEANAQAEQKDSPTGNRLTHG